MKKHFLTLIAVFTLLAAASLLLTNNLPQNKTKVKGATACGGLYISVYSSDNTASTSLNGDIRFSVGLSSSNNLPKKIIIYANGMPIGQARPDSSSSYSWTMIMPSSLLANGVYKFKAVARYPDGAECASTITDAHIESSHQTSFDIMPSRKYIETQVNSSASIFATVIVPDRPNDYARYALFEWNTLKLGTVNKTQKSSTMFYAGPVTGSSELVILVRFGQHQKDVSVPTKILSATSPLPVTETQTTTVSSDDSMQSSPDSTNSAALSDEDVETKKCLIAAVGEKRFKEINSGASRPTKEELLKGRACFAKASYVMPTNFAPVDPKEIDKLPTTKDAKISGIKKSTQNRNDEEYTTLHFSGTARPNSTVFLYIFSEPLVLTVTANDQGRWEYELENPLEPGEHTAYAVVDRGDGNYHKTQPFAFLIGTAEATAENPNGLSLDLESPTKATATQSNRSTVIYLASAAAVLALSGLTAFLIIKKRQRRRKEAASDNKDALLQPDQSNSTQKSKDDDSTNYPEPDRPESENNSTEDQTKSEDEQNQT